MLAKIFSKINIKKSDKAKIVCIGSSAKDIFFPTVDGNIFETPDDLFSQRKIAFELGAKFQVEDRYETLGGCAANVSAGLARLGSNVYCYTKVGNDMLGRWIKKEMEKNGINTDLVMIEDLCKSDLSSIIVDSSSGERIIFFNRGANKKLEIHEKMLEDANWIFVSALNGDWEENLRKILKICEDNAIKIAFNPGSENIKNNPKLIREVIGKSEVVILNKDEAVEILFSKNPSFESEDINDESFILGKMSKMCEGRIVLTDGQRGAWFISGGNVFHAPALIAHAVDSTGAGDSFSSAFLDGYIRNLPVEECVKRGIVNSNSVVKKFGPIEGLLNESDISNGIARVKVEKIS